MSEYEKGHLLPRHSAHQGLGGQPASVDHAYYSLYCYLWDVLDLGVTSFAKLVRSLGLTHISLASSYHGGKALLPHNRTRHVYFIEDGAVYFRPASRFFKGRSMQPRVSRLVKKRDYFRDLVDECQERGVKTTAWTVALHNTHLGNSYPQLTSQNVFGDRYVHALCLSQPAVIGYLRSIAQNLAAYNIDAVEFETFEYVPFRHYSFLEKEGIAVSKLACLLLSLCFCPACLKHAGKRKIPTRPLIAGVTKWLHSYFDGANRSLDPINKPIAAIPGLEDYLQMRFDVVTAAFENVSADLHERGKRVIFLSVGQMEQRDHLTGVDLKCIGRCSDAVETLFYARRSDEAKPLIRALQNAIGTGREIYCALRPGYPDAGSSDDVETLTRSVLAAGAAGVSYYNFGLIENCRLPWIHRAICETSDLSSISKEKQASVSSVAPMSAEGLMRANVLRRSF